MEYEFEKEEFKRQTETMGIARKVKRGFPYFYAYVAWSLVFIGAVEAVWGLCQLYGFSVSGHSRYALTGSFFNPGPYAGYLAKISPEKKKVSDSSEIHRC